ncbi:MAG: hypothetical protein V4536_08535 [Pseudomonadota bacterium]
MKNNQAFPESGIVTIPMVASFAIVSESMVKRWLARGVLVRLPAFGAKLTRMDAAEVRTALSRR